MNRKAIQTILLSCAVALAITAPVSARQYNQPKKLNSNLQVKVNKALAQGQRLRDEESVTGTAAFGSCGNLNINRIDAPRPGEPPVRDQITVVTGDVINVVTRSCK